MFCELNELTLLLITSNRVHENQLTIAIGTRKEGKQIFPTLDFNVICWVKLIPKFTNKQHWGKWNKNIQNQQETGTEGAEITVKVIKLLINKIKRCLIAQHVATLQYIILIANKLQ